MARKALLTFGVLIALFLAAALSRPTHVTVERKLTIAAPQDLVFSYLGDLRQWEQWYAFEKLDPELKRTFSGPPLGVGSVYAWAGSSAVGEGTLTVASLKAPDAMTLDVEFLRPRPSKATLGFELSTVAGVTAVTARVELTNDFWSKLMSLALDASKTTGNDLDKSLEELKFVAESEAARRAAPPEPDEPEEPAPADDAGTAGGADDAGATGNAGDAGTP